MKDIAAFNLFCFVMYVFIKCILSA